MYYLGELCGVLAIASIAWAIGRALHVVIGRNDARKRVHGQRIPEWIAATVVSFGASALLYFGPEPNVPYPPSAGCAAFGIIGGLFLGNVHGWIRLANHVPKKSASANRSRRGSTNPYEPPS
ncbi:hypothetical protein [Rubripirellula tenax]|uniref:hypothetical protein n=1 Tax=Rubripirellula tenax TaxID=2528015 RepID=UPI001644215A|nr:hypothetical protein [Rubripirellula tenax]